MNVDQQAVIISKIKSENPPVPQEGVFLYLECVLIKGPTGSDRIIAVMDRKLPNPLPEGYDVYVHLPGTLKEIVNDSFQHLGLSVETDGQALAYLVEAEQYSFSVHDPNGVATVLVCLSE
jgi:hypothetical protein